MLPLFKTLAFPRVLPVLPFLVAVCYGVWRWEGVQELFLGLVLFQALLGVAGNAVAGAASVTSAASSRRVLRICCALSAATSARRASCSTSPGLLGE